MGGCLSVVNAELWYDKGRVTPGGVEVAAAFEVVLVKVIGVWVTVALRRAACVCVRGVHAQ